MDKYLIEQVLEEVIRQRETLPEYDYFGSNNWVDLDIQIKLLRDAKNNNSINWFDIEEHINDNYLQGAIACKDWLEGNSDDYCNDTLNLK